jgi:hypothetical protein
MNYLSEIKKFNILKKNFNSSKSQKQKHFNNLINQKQFNNLINQKTSNSKKKYVFILCPPYQGSTILINLLDSSINTTTFVKAPVQFGEGQWLLEKHNILSYELNRWNPNYELDMDKLKEIYDNYWDHSKTIYVEKSPPLICRAKMFENYFKQFGEVYFIVSIRSPYSTNHYSTEEWVKFAEYQKNNIQNLENCIVTSYEELCLSTNKVIEKIKNTIPELSDIKNQQNDYIKSERGNPINKNSVDRVINKNYECLKNHKELMHFFGYEILNIS